MAKLLLKDHILYRGCEYSGGAHERKGEEELTQTVLGERRKFKEERKRESQFSEDLQTLLFSQLCLVAL